MKISIVIPVFNSSKFTSELLERLKKYFSLTKYEYELIFVDDGSGDNSWGNLKKISHQQRNIKCIKLLKNYGQHVAVLCGLRNAMGDYCIVMDDDLQNPPEEIDKLINKSLETDSDLVFAKFKEKKTSLVRKLGSYATNILVRKIFNVKTNIRISNFKLIRKDVVNRVIKFKSSHPYINGIALMYSKNPQNVLVNHQERKFGKSNYNIFKISSLLGTIMFNYSNLPMRILTTTGFIISLIGFFLGIYFFIDRITNQGVYSGWASIFIALCFFSGINLFILGIFGEYIIKINNQTKLLDQYIIDEEYPKR